MLYFERVNPDDRKQIECLLRWENDPVLSETLRPNFYDQPLPEVTYQEVERCMRQSDRVCFLFANGQGRWLGYVSLQIAHPVILRRKEESGWLGICIGEAEGRGRGYGKLAMDFIEEQARTLGLKRIELGFFDFNDNARKLYERCGYRYFAEEPDFAWHNGVKFSDIRMEKSLE